MRRCTQTPVAILFMGVCLFLFAGNAFAAVDLQIDMDRLEQSLEVVRRIIPDDSCLVTAGCANSAGEKIFVRFDIPLYNNGDEPFTIEPQATKAPAECQGMTGFDNFLYLRLTGPENFDAVRQLTVCLHDTQPSPAYTGDEDLVLPNADFYNSTSGLYRNCSAQQGIHPGWETFIPKQVDCAGSFDMSRPGISAAIPVLSGTYTLTISLSPSYSSQSSTEEWTLDFQYEEPACSYEPYYEVENVEFEWFDNSGHMDTGIDSTTASSLFSLGSLPWKFYCEDAIQLTVNRAGIVGFGVQSIIGLEEQPPSDSIAVYWSNQLEFEGNSNVTFFLQDTGENPHFIVTWENVGTLSGSANLTFQIKYFLETGDFQLNYADTNVSTLGSAHQGLFTTIGTCGKDSEQCVVYRPWTDVETLVPGHTSLFFRRMSYEIIPAPVIDADNNITIPFQIVKEEITTFNGTPTARANPDSTLEYQWIFGDGLRPPVISTVVDHIYSTKGNYTVSLIVYDGNKEVAYYRDVDVLPFIPGQYTDESENVPKGGDDSTDTLPIVLGVVFGIVGLIVIVGLVAIVVLFLFNMSFIDKSGKWWATEQKYQNLL
ncbi:hypothetical protein QOT17_016853 [Balamuthia mandrillaris]